MIAGHLAKTRSARPELLLAAADFLARALDARPRAGRVVARDRRVRALLRERRSRRVRRDPPVVRARARPRVRHARVRRGAHGARARLLRRARAARRAARARGPGRGAAHRAGRRRRLPVWEARARATRSRRRSTRSLRCAGWPAREESAHVQSRVAPRGDRGRGARARVPRVPRSAPDVGRRDRPHAPARRRAARARASAAAASAARSRTGSRARTTSRSTCYNGNEYLEGMLGAFKARCVPVNVNYRYVDEELVYLFENARARAVIYHARFAPTLARIRAQLGDVRLWLQVADDSGEPLLPGALDYEAALAGATPARAGRALARRPLRALHRRHDGHAEGRALAPGGHLPRRALPAADRDASTRWSRTREQGDIRALPAPPFMHGAAHWVAFNMWYVGGTIVVQSHPDRLDPADIWSTVERERVSALTIVGDAFARPLADELRARPLRRCRRCACVHLGRRDPHRGAQARAARAAAGRAPARRARLVGERRAGAVTPRRTPAAPRRAASSSRPATSCCARTSRARSRRAAASRAGSRAAARCRSATSATPRRPRRRSP